MIPLPTRAAAIAAISCLFPVVADAQLEISEILAENRDGLTDSDGDSSDWIEIRNTGTDPVDLAGWRLTDREDDLAKWTFPSVTIPGGGFLVVFASGKDRTDPAAELHTNFALSSSGEYLGLVDPGGTVESTLAFPEQQEDVSYGISGRVVNLTLLEEGAACRWRVPTEEIAGWQTREFDDGLWQTGNTGVGYDTGDDFDALIGVDVQAAMRGFNQTVYIRVPFSVTNAADVISMILNMRYDDGFVAWVNGVEVASMNAPEVRTWDSGATGIHQDSQAILKEPFEINAALGALVEGGGNVLAIQLLNRGVASSDLIAMPEIIASAPDPIMPTAAGFMLTPSPGAPNGNSVEGFVADTKFSLDRGFYDTPIAVEITSETEGATIRYTTDGSAPDETTGTVYTAPVTISSSTVLRAIAYRDGWEPTNVDTQTYLFPSDVKEQTTMDQDVVDNPDYSGTIESDISNTLPTLSLVVDDADFFGTGGIYRNPTNTGRGAEVPLSVEFFNPQDPDEQFQIDAGIRIHGGNARSHPKKPLRLYFRGEYGARRLEHPLFEGSPVASFDQLILRGGGHDSWSLAATFGRQSDDLPPNGTVMRDQFLRKIENEMGLLSPKSRYVHVFINTSYWGVYDLHERANAAYFESYFGGEESDYDVLHHPSLVGQRYVIVDGSATAWEEARTIAAGGITTESEYVAIQEYFDLDELIDHMIVRMWSGDFDWCGPMRQSDLNRDVTWFRNKNWYSGRKTRGDEPGTFKMFCWDAEMSMGLHLLGNPGFFSQQTVVDFDLTGVNDDGSPTEFYDALRNYPDFQQRFGDRLQQHLFGDGVMTVEANTARWDSMVEELRAPMVAESARWGDEGASSGQFFSRDDTWIPETEWVRNTFIAVRNEKLLGQFRARGLYPDTDAPEFSQFGGQVPAGYELAMTSPGNTIYYTVDGSDPMDLPELETLTLIADVAPAEAFIPTAANGGSTLALEDWTNIAPPPNAASWISGQSGIGYETSGSTFRPLINLDTVGARGTNASVFIRMPFEVPADVATDDLLSLTLGMRYDDGFVAYLNGVRVMSANSPANPSWNSTALGGRSGGDSQAIQFEDFDITAFKDLLVPGATNLLAIHALNDGPASSDMLHSPRLRATQAPSDEGVSSQPYVGPVPLEASTRVLARSLASDGEWSALVDATFLVGTLASSSNLVVSEFNYRPLPPTTEAELAVANTRTDFEFIELQNISSEPVDLTGVTFSQGVSFDFVLGGSNNLVPPGGYVLVVEDAVAFAARYGEDVAARVAGEFADGSKLSNNGEAITLLAADGSVIQTFTYSDSPPWPTEPDGEGATLELIAPETNPDHALPGNWMASNAIGGTPGAATPINEAYAMWAATTFAGAPAGTNTSPNGDADGDGWDNMAEYVLSSSPLDGGSIPMIEVFVADVEGTEYLAARFVVNQDAADVNISGQTSTDLGDWSGQTVLLSNPVDNGDGTETRSLRAADPVSGTTRQLRLRLAF